MNFVTSTSIGGFPPTAVWQTSAFPTPHPATSQAGTVTVKTTDKGFITSVPISMKHKLDDYIPESFAVKFGGDISGISEDIKDLLEIYKFIGGDVLPSFARFFP